MSEEYLPFEGAFDQKVSQINSKGLSIIAKALYQPLATASDPFFRKNLGERYFTTGCALLGFMLWVAAGEIGQFLGPIFPEFLATRQLFSLARWFSEHDISRGVGMGMAAAYGILAWKSIGATKQRQINGARWHSMSRGESWFGSEDFNRDVVLSVLLGGLLFAFAPLTGLLFGVSRFLSYYLLDIEAQALYNRYLDQVDAEIMAGCLEPALNGGPPPKITDGIYGPLPKHFEGEHRADVAQTIADTVRVQGVAKARTRKNTSGTPAQKPSASEASSSQSGTSTQAPGGKTEASDASQTSSVKPNAHSDPAEKSKSAQTVEPSASQPFSATSPSVVRHPGWIDACFYSTKTVCQRVGTLVANKGFWILLCIICLFVFLAAKAAQALKEVFTKRDAPVAIQSNPYVNTGESKPINHPVVLSDHKRSSERTNSNQPIVSKSSRGADETRSNMASSSNSVQASLRQISNAPVSSVSTQVAQVSASNATGPPVQSEAETLALDIHKVLQAEQKKFGEFKANCDAMLRENEAKIKTAKLLSRGFLTAKNEGARGNLNYAINSQTAALRSWQEILPSLQSMPHSGLKELRNQLANLSSSLENQREQAKFPIETTAWEIQAKQK